MEKYKRRILIMLIALLLFVGMTVTQGATSYAEKSKIERDKTEILIKYKDESKVDGIKNDLKSKLKLSKFNIKEKHKKIKMDLMEIGENDNITSVINELKKDSNIEYVQPNYKLETKTIPSDANFAEQWALSNTGQTVGTKAGRSGVDINVLPAWNVTTGSSDVVVGLLDSGVDINHPDVANSIYINQNEIPDNGIDDDGNGFIDDRYGWDFANGDQTVFDSVYDDTHGTQMAGIIAAQANSEGIIGVAPGVKILPLKFMSGNMGYTSDAIAAIDYAITMGVKIVNCSFGSTDNNAALKDAMQNSGILFICAAGNEGESEVPYNVYPAAFDLGNVLSVGAIDNTGIMASFSSKGSNVDVAAPGVGILTTNPDNTYLSINGTSAAAAHVTGIAALLKSAEPGISNEDIVNRIKSNVVVCSSLQGKVNTNGRVDANAALTNTPPASDSYTDPEDNMTVIEPIDNQEAGDGTLTTMVEPAQLAEMLHYGEDGVYPGSGNFSFNCTDMSIDAPGFDMEIGRTYNSKGYPANFNTDQSFGKGWRFSFDCCIERWDSDIKLILPDGKIESFNRHNDGTITSYNTRDKLTMTLENDKYVYTLVTQDQYTYKFADREDSFGHHVNLSWIKDRNGNTILLHYNCDKRLDTITDFAGRTFTITYNSSNQLIDTITDSTGRQVKYGYDQRFLEVTDPMGNIMRYHYNSKGLIDQILDHNSNVIESITYYNIPCNWEDDRVKSVEDSFGNIYNYSYSRTSTDSEACIKDKDNRTWYYKYDDWLNQTKYTDPAGLNETNYYGGDLVDRMLGEIKTTTDRNSNPTSYERDGNGNITRISNPDGSHKEFLYDDKSNKIFEKDENGKCTYYIYDTGKINLLKKVQPLNGTDVYSEAADQSKFAITYYTYYTQQDGCSRLGLLHTEKDPDDNITEYTYDTYGNIATVKNPDGKITTYQYNSLGWKTAEISPKQYRTEYKYDLNGLLEKTTLHGGETTRIVYDNLGRKTKEVTPKLYNSADDQLDNHTYSGDVGTRYTYYANSKIHTLIDAENNTTSYTYDKYGNVQTETKPDGGIYTYYYDNIDRLKKKTFKEDANSQEITLEEYFYNILSNKNTTKTVRKYYNDINSFYLESSKNTNTTSKSYSDTIYTYDYAERLIEQQNPDGTSLKYKYNYNGTLDSTVDADGSSTTYYKYDGLNRLTETWTPFENSNGITKYTYTAIDYYKNGLKYHEKTGKQTVDLYGLPSTYVTKEYTYYGDGNVHTETNTSSGEYTEYTYDDGGYLSMEKVKVSDGKYQITEYDNNYLGKPLYKYEHIRTGDIAGNDPANDVDTRLTTAYTYDKNGNLETETDAKNVTTTYEYDNLDRLKKVKEPWKDEQGNETISETSYEYNWEGKKTKATDAKNNQTIYEYDKRGFIVKETDANNGVTAYEYDRAGRLLEEVSPENYVSGQAISGMNHTEYAYDNMDRVKTKAEKYTDPIDGQCYETVTKAYKYDSKGRVKKELDAKGYASVTGLVDDKINNGYGTEYEYNLAGKLVKTLDPDSKEKGLTYTEQNTYDALGRNKTKTNAKGIVTTYYYDDADNITNTTVKKSPASPEKTIMSATYDKVGNKLTATDGNGNTTTYEYSSFNKVSKMIEPGDESIPSNITIYQYDSLGNLAKQSDSTGLVKLYTYDYQGRVQTSTEEKADGTESITTTTYYDKNGNKEKEIDGKGYITTKTYDEMDRLKTVTDTKNHTTVYGYDLNGNLTSTTDWRGNAYTNVYDPLNRLRVKNDPYCTIQKLTYDLNGLQQYSYDALNNKTEFQYDKNNRLTSTIDPEGDIISQTYDDIGNISTKTDGKNDTTQFKYDEYNKLTDIINAKGETTSYSYDMNGNMLTQKDGKGNISYFKYNVDNKLKERIDAGGKSSEQASLPSRTESYTYYADGSLKSKVDRNGKTTNYQYDVHGRLMNESVGSIFTSYEYDDNGNQLKVIDSTGETVRVYDELNRTISKTAPNIGETKFEYDIITGVDAGCTAETTTDPKGNIVKKVYDKAGRLISVTADGKTNTYEYYQNGSKKKVTYNNGSSEEYTYRTDNLLETLVNKKADGSTADSYQYTYDSAHNLETKTDSKGVTSYTYDGLNRLKTVTEPSGKVTSYEYDAAGNRSSETTTQDGKTTLISYTYNDQNRLLTMVTTKPDGTKETTSYTYDNNGNLLMEQSEKQQEEDPTKEPSISVSVAGEEEQNGENYISLYEYDELNQLVKSTVGSDIVTNTYNGEGTRVAKEVNGDKTRYLYEGNNVILELDGSGNEKAHNVHGTSLLSRTADGQTADYFYNGHGDVTLLLGEDGQQLASYYYDAFGNPETVNESVYNPYRYAGYMWDEETGKYYLMARMYDPVTARFLQEDTYRGQANDPLSLNLYTYCHNEPLMYSDPDGHANEQIPVKESNWAKGYYVKFTKQGSGKSKIEIINPKNNKVIKTLHQGSKDKGDYYITKEGKAYYWNKSSKSAVKSEYNKVPVVSNNKPISKVMIKKKNTFGQDYIQGVKDAAINDRVNKAKQIIKNPSTVVVDIATMPTNIIFAPITTNVDAFNNFVLGDNHQRANYLGRQTEQLAEIALTYGITKGVTKTARYTEVTVKTVGRDPMDIIQSAQKAGKGNTGIGSGTYSEAWDAGWSWAGPNAKTIYNKNGELIGLSSEDGLRAFRVDYKPKWNQYQANFQQNQRIYNSSKNVEEVMQVSNSHLTITDK